MKLKRDGIDVRALDNADMAWFYENKGSIDVYIRVQGGATASATTSCRIPRKLLEDYLRRSKAVK